jgi:DNA repair and recombination protein RAD54B
MFNCLANGYGCILADEMGLGKTIQAISLIWTLKQKTLIVCPSSLVTNWINEFKKWLGDVRLKPFVVDGFIEDFSKVYLINYEKVVKFKTELLAMKFKLIVCDEGHRLKSGNSKCIKTLEMMNSKKIILSGTPVQNNLGEFYSLCNFVNPGFFVNYKKFISKYDMLSTDNAINDCSKTLEMVYEF